MDKGFEYYYGQLDQGYCHNYYPYLMDFGVITANGTQNTTKIPIEPNQNASNANCGADRLLCRWSGDLWTEQATFFISQTTASTEPWLLYLSYTAPHAGGVGTDSEGQPPVPRISTGPYEKNAADLGKEIGYASAVTEIDNQLGLVLASIETAGIASSTVVFFASRKQDPPASRESARGRWWIASPPFQSIYQWGRSSPSVSSRCGSLLLSASADVRTSADATAS